MPNFHIVKESKLKSSFRISSILGQFDLKKDIKEEFFGNIPIENINDWNIGLICGNSGTGKTVIAKEIFKEEYFYNNFDINNNNIAIIDEMPKNKSIKEITKMFNSVGFSSPPSWLKPYRVLSNGEKMRVDLAYALLQDIPVIVFDEFTSVVDRNIAKISCFAINKALRKNNKKFVAISCHDDIIEWLQPDWIFNTNIMEFKNTRGLLPPRPNIELSIFECAREYWRFFRKYHYLNANIHRGSKCYLATIKNNPVAFIGILHQPNAYLKNIKRVHRLVVLPDYQGIGIGNKLLEFIGNRYLENKYKYNIITSNPALINYFEKNKKWELVKAGRNSAHSGFKGKKIKKIWKNDRFITSWTMIKRANN